MTNIFLSGFLTCVLSAGSAAAQTTVSASAARAATPAVPAVPFSSFNGGGNLVSPLSSLGLTPTLSAPSVSLTIPLAAASAVAVQPSALANAVQPAAVIPAAMPVAVKALPLATAALPVLPARAQSTALAVLSAANVPDDMPAKLDALFDGSENRAGDVGVTASPATKSRPGMLGRAALAAAVFIAHPGIALAAQVPAAVDPGVMTLVTSYHPLATAIAAVIGALFGLWSARSKDGSPANAGQVLSSAISHGAISGAAAFTLIDLTKVLFLGASAAALTPLTAAVATAALAQAAFAAKFTDPATTPADRIIGAFPAVAMAFGLGIGVVTLMAPVGLLALSASAMMATGAATALFTALFRLEKSPAAGPAAMGRGVVLQTLMTGLALALGPSPYTLFFFGLGMWGFATVMAATGKEVWTATQELRARFKKKP